MDSDKDLDRFLFLTCARGGSKSISQKNMQLVDNKSLIQRAFESSRLSEEIVHYLSSDCERILSHGKFLGYEILKRPEELATDSSLQIDSIIHALKQIEQTSVLPEYLVLLQPTSPFRTSTHVHAAVQEIMRSGASSLVSVLNTSDRGPSFLYEQSTEDISLLKPISYVAGGTNRQSVPKCYWRNGAIYISKIKLLLSTRSIVDPSSLTFIEMESKDSINIDSPIDLFIARALASYK